ncbi:hypothetical protein M8C21_011622 [Ambrosia artemisiifolia]|uniref:Polymerase/histidinol phosphatase N-terminal domain-containing protein n=1 Tax=Ambrosia artemisiifolia TaxID=4212 RepID=A0AAD5GK38_AMBAR|nr:hypothetical protein M8C21_011622 [Ambrosia artemisiifolia]
MGSNTCNHNKKKKNNNNNNKRSGSKKRMTHEQSLAYKSVSEWVFLDTDSCSPNSTISIDDNFKVKLVHTKASSEKLVFELHSHSICSDGFLSPSKLVEKAHQYGSLLPVCMYDIGLRNANKDEQVKVLSLTDHDTMAGIPQAIEAARKVGIKIIPGVEISTIFTPRTDTGSEEPVHVLAYYSSCGPSNFEKLDRFLANIRDGRYLRAKNMISKLNKLKLPIRWENVEKIAGDGVAPGRLHVARAMVEAGHVENLKQAFSRYLYDGGPAYSTGSEPDVEEAVRLICETGGVAVLAHPWALKNPVAIIRRLKEAGLHGLEVYRSDGKLAAFSDLADTYDLLKLGGSDYHARGGSSESALGSVSLPMVAVHEFLKVARPIWCGAIKKTVDRYVTEPTESNLEHILRYAKIKVVKGGAVSSITTRNIEIIHECLSQWLTNEEQKSFDFEAITHAEDKP